MKKSDTSHANLEQLSRENKAKKIIVVLEEFKNIGSCRVLDVGTGSGHIAYELSKISRTLDSVDLHDERILSKGYKFHKVPNELLPFPNDTFDIAISNHVLEHVPNQTVHINEIHRVLKKEGILYLATPNRWWPIDPHYKIPFITWFPRKLAQAYFQLFAKKKWDIYSLSYPSIRELARDKFIIHNISLQILQNPKKFKLDIYKPLQPLLSLIPSWLLRLLNPFIPTYVLVLKKK
jgi:ubiquinone/menaquinone biosynthesis C-methylase UbiE